MIGVVLSFLIVLLVLVAKNRESHRIAPAEVFTPAVDLPDVSFYELASSRIRPEILHEIERGLVVDPATEPCPSSSDGRHRWEIDRTDIEQFGGPAPFRIEPFWWCARCAAGTSTRPTKADVVAQS